MFIKQLHLLYYLQEAGIRIATLATDRHPQVTKTIRSLFPSISHQFDVWHLAKSITKKLNSASKTKENENLQPWIRSIVNHFWWSTETCNKDPKQLKVISNHIFPTFSVENIAYVKLQLYAIWQVNKDILQK